MVPAVGLHYCFFRFHISAEIAISVIYICACEKAGGN